MTQTAELPGRRAVPEHVRRLSRYKFARLRVEQIADGTPRLTDEELEELAAVLLAARTGKKKKKRAA
jgi:hypothetical protein